MGSKKSTDCVYFLASPLTCKKGMQCEFRHSEVARLNPRDCWYWLSGNCLNPDCAFRHPPLDTEDEEREPSPEPTTSKVRVPCYFYSQGYCAKGDKCSFMHGYSRVFQAPKAVEINPNLRKTPAEITTRAPEVEETKKVEESSSEQQPGEQKLGWSSISPGAGAEEELYVDNGAYEEDDDEDEQLEEEEDDEEEDEEEAGYGEGDGEDDDMVLNPGNVPGYQPARPGYNLEWGLQTCGSTGAHRDFSKLYDPPYQPSAPYDCMIASRQSMVEERRLVEPEIEALLMARGLGVNHHHHRRRLEDRLVFPRSNNNNSAANRVKVLSSSNGCFTALRPRVENLRRVSNGGILSRLGTSRASVKSRLRYNQRQQQLQLQQGVNHQNHRHSKSARYLGIVRQQNQRRQQSRISKRAGKQNRKVIGGNSNPINTTTNNNNNNNVKASSGTPQLLPSQFDGPKSLAELKAAKLS